MNPSIQHGWTPEERARYGLRGMAAWTTEELALRQAKLAAGMRQRAPHPGRTRHRAPLVRTRRTTAPA
jgi:hypothetical protein